MTDSAVPSRALFDPGGPLHPGMRSPSCRICLPCEMPFDSSSGQSVAVSRLSELPSASINLGDYVVSSPCRQGCLLFGPEVLPAPNHHRFG